MNAFQALRLVQVQVKTEFLKLESEMRHKKGNRFNDFPSTAAASNVTIIKLIVYARTLQKFPTTQSFSIIRLIMQFVRAFPIHLHTK